MATQGPWQINRTRFSHLPLPLSNPSFLEESALLLGRKQTELTKVSFSNHKTKELQFVNLQYRKAWWEAGKRFVKLGLSTKALKTIEKNGFDAVTKKAGIDALQEVEIVD